MYVVNGMNKEWPVLWKSRGWTNAVGYPIKNQDLWERLWLVNLENNVAWHHVKGHSGHPLNDEVDRLAKKAKIMVCSHDP
jgi:ribonuclease HI